MKRVLQIVTLSEWGGAQHIVYLLAKYLRSDYEITVACAPGGPLGGRLRAEGIRVLEIPELCRNPHPIRDPRALWKLYHLMKRERFEIVHTHSTKAGLLGRLAAAWAQVPIILFTAHGWAFSEGRLGPWRWLLAQVERLPARFSTKIICVSEYDRQLALRFRVAPKEKLVVIHNGVEPEPFCLTTDKRELRLRLGMSDAAGVVTMVGRFAPPKDFETLIAAWEGLRAPSWQLWLVGEGPRRSRLEELVRAKGLCQHIRFLRERHDVPAILKASDIFVLSSRWEGLPLTVIEAMFAGLPVIATRVGGVPELVEEGITGLLVPARDTRALGNALEQLINSAELRQRMGELGRQRALRQFTVDRMIRHMQALYREVESHLSFE
ncbi:MAG: glycosyltransferase family 4 protein [Candidatus Bipolaricaulota bacterium]|nr:glycosyltransferase family 4 protein [Candidatus Bipolaricaulota bacterium]MDW8030966.1 glycosyltransferase family 4 protein [Candidatus Bipolaricaulota bacterium]